MVNYIKTLSLFGILTAILVLVGWFLGGQDGLITAFIFSLIINAGAYFFSDKIALSFSQAKPLSSKEAPEIYAMVADLAAKMKIPPPKIFITPDKQANAFATGRDSKHASIAITSGIVNLLNPLELKAVLAHELSHVNNQDILIVTLAAVIASAISFLARNQFHGGFSRNENRRSGILDLFLLLLAPLAATLIQLAISRQREYQADYSGARVLGTGQPLASALLKLDASTKQIPVVNTPPALAQLYIASPFGGVTGSLANLFSTHPPISERVKRLQEKVL
ncbi:M48 family metalloprotease [Candidatus Microgenomates bacterium]|nr:M48 family metalloprotease [Candidatus Microgenomates bacterium]